MFSNRTLHIFLTLSLLGLSVGLKYWYKDSVILTSFSGQITEYLEENEKDFDLTVKKHGAELPTLFTSAGPNQLDSVKAILQQISAKPYTFFGFRGDSIAFWNNNFDLPQKNQLGAIVQSKTKTLIKLPTGQYYLVKQPLGSYELACLIPVKYSFGTNMDAGANPFPASHNMPQEIAVSADISQNHQIKNTDGAVIGSLSAPSGVVYKLPQRVELVLFILFIIAYFSLTYNMGAEIALKKNVTAATLFLLAAIGFFFTLKIGFGLTSGFAGASVFGLSLESFGSLGDLLLYLGILLWLMIFFHKEYEVRSQPDTPMALRMILATFYYLAVMASVLISLVILKHLVFSSSVVFDFDNLFNLDFYNMLLIWGVIMMMGAMFLYSHKLITSLHELNLNLTMRSVSIVLAGILISLLYIFGVSIDLPTYFVVFFTITYVVAFDLFIEKKRSDFYWVLIWLGLYSLYAAMVLYHFNSIKDINTRVEYARQLSIPKDSTAEQQIVDLYQKIKGDKELNQIFRPVLTSTPKDSLLAHINSKIKPESYLQLYYKPDVAVYNPNKIEQLDKNYLYHQMVDTFFSQGQSVLGMDSIRHYGESPLNFRYTMHLPVLRLNLAEEPLDMYVTFTRKSSPNSMVYNEVFFDRQYKDLEFLDRYDYAIFEKNIPVYQKGRINEALFDPALFPDKDAHRNYIDTERNRTDLTLTDKSGNVTVVVGRSAGNFMKKIYLASGIFTILSVFMLLLAGVNSWFVQILPDYYKFYIKTRGSLSKRIQYYTVFLILGSLISIGILTYLNFKDSSLQGEIDKQDYLANTLFKNLKRDLESKPAVLDSQILAIKNKLPDFVNEFDKDVDLYDAKGGLIATSRQDLRQEGLLQQHMNSKAFFELACKKYSEVLSDEKIAGIPFKRKYYALRNSNLETIAFIGIPYYLPQYNINPSNSDFMGKVLTAFVLLLVIGVVLTMKISSSIIDPLKTIIDKMKQQRMEEKHVPLVVDSDGEELVNLSLEYNNLIGKIEDFTEKLAERERDLAWREMAAMVAHEIKNAMTTIKLSLQNVHEAKKTNDQEVVNRFLDKAIYRNLMQVESLSRIAKDFGDFSMLQIPKRAPIFLNKAVKDIFECFEEDKKVEFVLTLPKEQIYTLGDEDSFIRVINNLMINAKEAIPDDRKKRVEVSLYRRDDKCFIKVTDNGSGVPEDIQQKIFTPKFSTKSSGTGLGLGICKQIVEALEGKIYFTTVKDVGTEFYVELPVVPKPTEDEEGVPTASVKSRN